MIILGCILAVIVIFLLVVLLYHNNAYPQTQEIAEQMDQEGKDYWFYGDSDVGFIIFAGAKSDEKGYSYLAQLLNEQGYTVVIPKQPFYMSSFGARHAEEIMEEHTEVRRWILIGHSLGGLPVSRIADEEPERLAGIVFLATMSMRDLTDLPFPALRISADNDGIMNNERMDRSDGNLPAGSESIMLTGANHNGFSGYKPGSRRDGEAAMTWQEQNEMTVQLILEFYADSIAAIEAE